nr:immunoglobulin heavy chain junction region [Macaca mulatta]
CVSGRRQLDFDYW